jgi:syntaxin 1B/2/3
MVVSDHLLTERIAEFQRLAQTKGTLKGDADQGENLSPQPVAAGSKPNLYGKGVKDPASKCAFMKEFHDRVKEINALLSKVRAAVKDLADVQEDALQATTPEKKTQASEKLNNIQVETQNNIDGATKILEQLSHRPDVEEKDKVREIRENMRKHLLQKHRNLACDFSKACQECQNALTERQVREIRMVLPEESEAEIKERINKGENLSVVVAQKMAGTHHMLIDEINRIQEQHQDILRLARSVNHVAQMMNEMAVLVDEQGQMLDNIVLNVRKAKANTAKAEVELKATRVYQVKNQKCVCCLAVIMLIILMAILLPVLTQQ